MTCGRSPWSQSRPKPETDPFWPRHVLVTAKWVFLRLQLEGVKSFHPLPVDHYTILWGGQLKIKKKPIKRYNDPPPHSSRLAAGADHGLTRAVLTNISERYCLLFRLFFATLKQRVSIACETVRYFSHDSSM